MDSSLSADMQTRKKNCLRLSLIEIRDRGFALWAFRTAGLVSIFTEMFKDFIEYLHCVRLSIDKSCRTSIGVTECAMGTLTLPVIRFMCFTGSL